MTTSLTGHVARGVRWNYAGSGLTLTAQLAYTATTARLISPREFGAYAAAQALIGIVGYLTLAPLGNAVIRQGRPSRRMIGTAVTLSIGAGATSACVVALAAPAWAELWRAPDSTSLIRLFSVSVLLSTTAVVPLALVRRALRFRAAATMEASAQVLGMAIGVGAAFETRSVAALVLGQVAASAVLSVGSIVLARRDVALAFSRHEARQLLRFSGQVSAQNIVYFAMYTAPSWVVSRVAGQVGLGYYSRANMIVTLPLSHLTVGLTKALYPLYGRLRNDRERTREVIESTLFTSVMFSWPAFAAAAGAAPLLVRVLLGPQWTEAGRLLPAFAAFAAVNIAFVIVGNPLEARAHFRQAWAIQGAWVTMLAGVLGVCLARGVSPLNLLLLVAAVEAVAHGAQVFVASRLGYVRLARVVRTYCFAAGVGGLFFVVPRVLASTVPDSLGATLTLALDLVVLAPLAMVPLAAALRRSRRAVPAEPPGPPMRPPAMASGIGEGA